MVEALTEWEPGPETNGWIALNIMGWQYRKVKGGMYTWIMPDGHYDTKAPDYTTDLAADYGVLCRVREVWNNDQLDAFETALVGICDKHRINSGRRRRRLSWVSDVMFYRPGDYSHAAHDALVEQGR